MSKAGRLLRKILPTVLTVVGAGATIAATWLAAKEGPLYQKALEEKEMTRKEKIITGVKTFAPAIGCAAVSVACSVGAHCMDLKTQASLTGAYVAIQEAYKKYRIKNGELNGEEADNAVRMNMEEEKLPEVIRNEDGDKVYTVYLQNLVDDVPVVKFKSTKAGVLMNILRINRILDIVGSLTLNDVCDFFEIERIKGGGELGWSVDMLHAMARQDFLDFGFETADDGSLIVYPRISANGSYLTEYGLDY